MWNNIAVVLRGHLRTWMWNSPAVFDFYNSIAHNVDYFVTTWETPNLRQEKIEISFEKANIEPKCYLKVGYQDREYTSWGGPALLSLHALPYMRQQHRQTPYDVVFDTRFDVVPHRFPDIPLTPIQKNTLYTTLFTNLLDKFGDRNIGMMDHMLVSQFEVFESMCDRIIVGSQDTKECHVDMLEFAKKQGFNVSNSLPWMNAFMTRPSDGLRWESPYAFGDPMAKPLDPEPCEMWEGLTVAKRLELLKMFNIEDIDYVTNNGNIAVEPLTDEVRSRFKN